MANKRISELPLTGTTNAQDFFHVSQGGVDKRIPAEDVLSQISGGSPFNLTVIEESSTFRLLSLSDVRGYIRTLNASETTLTVPNSSFSPWKLGHNIVITKAGAGNAVITPGAGVTINGSTAGIVLDKSGETARIVNVGGDKWDAVVFGNDNTDLQKLLDTNVSGTFFSPVGLSGIGSLDLSGWSRAEFPFYNVQGDGGGGVFDVTNDTTSATDKGLIFTDVNNTYRIKRSDQTTLDLLEFGAVGGDYAKDNDALARAIATAKLAVNVTINIPKSPNGLPYKVSRHIIENAKGLNITGVGVLKLDVSQQSGSSQIFHMINCEDCVIGHGLTLDGSRSEFVGGGDGIGFWDSPVTFRDCTDCKVSHAKVLNSLSVSVNICNGSLNCGVEYSYLYNSRYVAVQIHAGAIDQATGDYTDNKSPYHCYSDRNRIINCGNEGVRVTGCRSAKVTHNYIKWDATTICKNGIYVYTGTAPNAASIGGIENGGRNNIIEGNWIEGELDLLTGSIHCYILVRNAVDPGHLDPASKGKPLVGTKILNNIIVAKTDVIHILLRGHIYTTTKIEDTEIAGNQIFCSSLSDSAVFLGLYRYVKGVNCHDNQIYGRVRFFCQPNPNGYDIRKVKIENNFCQFVRDNFYKSFNTDGGTVTRINLEKNEVDDVAMATQDAAISLQDVDTVIRIRENEMTHRQGGLSVKFITGSATHNPANNIVEDNILTGLTASDSTLITFSHADTLKALVRNNVGFPTMAQGTATVLAGTNIITVPLFAGFAHMQVTPTGNGTGGNAWWAYRSGSDLVIRTSANVAADAPFFYTVSKFRQF